MKRRRRQKRRGKRRGRRGRRGKRNKRRRRRKRRSKRGRKRRRRMRRRRRRGKRARRGRGRWRHKLQRAKCPCSAPAVVVATNAQRCARALLQRSHTNLQVHVAHLSRSVQTAAAVLDKCREGVTSRLFGNVSLLESNATVGDQCEHVHDNWKQTFRESRQEASGLVRLLQLGRRQSKACAVVYQSSGAKARHRDDIAQKLQAQTQKLHTLSPGLDEIRGAYVELTQEVQQLQQCQQIKGKKAFERRLIRIGNVIKGFEHA